MQFLDLDPNQDTEFLSRLGGGTSEVNFSIVCLFGNKKSFILVIVTGKTIRNVCENQMSSGQTQCIISFQKLGVLSIFLSKKH